MHDAYSTLTLQVTMKTYIFQELPRNDMKYIHAWTIHSPYKIADTSLESVKRFGSAKWPVIHESST